MKTRRVAYTVPVYDSAQQIADLKAEQIRLESIIALSPGDLKRLVEIKTALKTYWNQT